MAEESSSWVPILRVKDAQVSAKFYREAMGFRVDWEHRFADGFPLYMQISRSPLVLHLSEHQGGGTTAAEFFVRVPDVDAVYRAIVDQGIETATEPSNQEYGMRDFCVVDPDGHRVTLGTPAGFPTEAHRSPEETSGE
jgi:uncharacterized glyoxalase superfamily protein PhnB